MQIIINKWRPDASQNALIHCETGEIQRLGEFQFILLETLIHHAGEVLPRAWLINEVWKNRVVGNNSLPTAIYALRVALGDDGRVQEIIKTIPKKGYVFNKDFIITLPENPAPDEAALSTTPPQSDNDAPENNTQPDVLPAPQEIKNPQKKYAKGGALLFLIIAIIIIVAVMFKFYNRATPPQENNTTAANEFLLHEEKNLETNHIYLAHLRRNNDEIHSAQLRTHMQADLSKINTLLGERQASLAIYYYLSVPKLSLVLLLTNRCQQQYQLIMNIENWRNNPTALGPLVYQEVERTLNEMPVCQ